MSEIYTIDPPLSEAQELAVSKLSSSDVNEIDNGLLENVIESWRKNAMVVGLTMIKTQGRFNDIPDVYYSQRLVSLFEQGRIEAQGDLLKIGRGEVRRLPRT
ncbi:DUF3658 domain-containing protein [Pseudomonas sp. GV071]|uniref:DUF3658 domain-containing protein n=1 Tax=Pseudomonas sp. GV071 TaxID=2135754 RepID=UPI000D35EFEF|nr:DUF3658 domain-containing protein [Pseudomonas sp. GV071]